LVKLVDDGEVRKFIIAEEWRTIEDHPRYEMSRAGIIRSVRTKKIRHEPNLGFRYYDGGVRKSIPIRVLLGRTFSDE
jgi:hypothetical protein